MLLGWLVHFIINMRHDKKNIRHVSSFMQVAVLAIIYILYPEILRKCILLLNCVLLDDSSNFRVLLYSPNVVCWGEYHVLWALALALPGILIWGIVVPLILLFALLKYRRQIVCALAETSKKNKNKEFINKEVINRKITIDVEPWIQEKLFKESELPLIQKVTYQMENKIINETVKVNVIPLPLSQNIIISDRIITSEKMAFLDDEDFIIKDKETLFNYLHLFDDLDKEAIAENELENRYIHVKIHYESERERDNKNMRVSRFAPKKQSESIINEQKEEKSFAFVNFGFIYKGYNEKYYFWEIVLFARKFLLIFIGVFTEFFPKETRDINLVLILMVFFLAQVKCKPFEKNFLNKLEKLSLLIATITCYIGILLYSETMQEASIFFLILVFLINAAYLGVWVHYLRKYGNLGELLQKIKAKFIRLKEKLEKCLKKKIQ